MIRAIIRALARRVTEVRNLVLTVLTNSQRGMVSRELKPVPRGEHHLPKVARRGDIIVVRRYDFTAREMEEFRPHRRTPLPKVKRPDPGTQPHSAWEG